MKINGLILCVLIFLVSVPAAAQVHTPNQLIDHIAANSFCQREGIEIIRMIGADGAIVSVCGLERFYRIRNGNVIDLGVYRPRDVLSPDTVRVMTTTRLRSNPSLWGTGLGLLIASYSAGVGMTAAVAANPSYWRCPYSSGCFREAGNVGFVSALGTIPIVGPIVGMTQLRNIEEGFYVLAAVDGIVQLVSWILIFTGSARKPVETTVRVSRTGLGIEF